MKKFTIRRILPAMLALSIMTSVSVVPVRAVDPATALETIQAVLGAVEAFSSFVDQVDGFLLGTYSQAYGLCWRSSDSAERSVLRVSETELNEIAAYINQKGYYAGVGAFVVTYPFSENAKCIELNVSGATKRRQVFLADPETGAVYVWDKDRDPDGALTPEEEKQYTAARWIPAQQVQLRSGFTVPVPLARLKELAAENGGTVYKSSITDDSGTADFYYVIKNGGRYILGDSGMRPYTYTGNRVANKPEDRPTGSIWVVDDNGNLVQMEDDDLPDNVGVDLGSLIGNLPTDSNVIFNGCTYDESTKTYYYHTEVPITIDNRQYYYFTYNYHINYTSITYIGTTAEYDKHYEVYYQLPDGRSSADLTAEELEQLNLSIDVINYGRSADDVSLRSLYHFDGDTDDDSYWNYCTAFTWNKGASLTYMDEGTFNGSLYLDETEHDFTFTLPSGLFGDFTLQWRYYQSATAAPQTDSYLNLGSTAVLKLDGANIKNGSGTTLSAMPVGSWNELALIRDSGTLYYYLNGVKIGSTANASVFDKVTFHFGSGQQTFKKLDEFRVLNTALQTGGASYIPTSVPHDTNLALVLPDTAAPIADEYWAMNFHDDATVFDFTNGATLDSSWSRRNLSVESLNSGLLIKAVSTGADSTYSDIVAGSSVDLSGSAYSLSWLTYTQSSLSADKAYSFQVSMVLGDGSVNEARFLVRKYSSGNSFFTLDGSQKGDYWHGCVPFSGCYFVASKNGSSSLNLNFVFDPTKTHNVLAIEIYCEEVAWALPDSVYTALSDRSTITTEHITSITAMTPEDLAMPTLAVRSDIPVTTWQIGGVRPSVPIKGQVWALVERQYITSLQIYNGRAWEACDGRVWTGSRWVPYSSYNVITLKDMSDIVDSSSPDKEYIYTESGFWDWWQRSWNAFTSKFFTLLEGGSGGLSPGGSGSMVSGSVAESLKNALSSLIDGLFGVIQTVLEILLEPVKNILSFVASLFTDSVISGIADFFSVFGDGSLWDFFQQEGEDGSSTVGLPGEIGVAFSFFSGVILALPSDLRFVLFFGVGIMVFFSILKIFARE